MSTKLFAQRSVARVLLLGLALPVGSPALAQLDEIVVTAERREQSLQDVPVAVTAFTADRVESLRLEDFEDLSIQIPGFSVNSFSKTRINPALRGGSSSLASAGAEQAVGLFIDDVYFGGPGDFELELFDVERIEVLRGPQGTLFGRNTTGGLINVVTRDPGDELEGKVQATVGNYDLNQLGAYLSAPLNDRVSASIAISSRDREGTSINTVTGNDVDDINRSAVRGKLLWRPNDDWSVKLGLTHTRASETGIARDAVSAQSTVDLDVLVDQNFVLDNNPRRVQMFQDGRFSSDQWVGSLHVERSFSNVSLQSITTARSFDADTTPISLTGVPVPLFALGDSREVDSFTQEFRLVSNNSERFSWQTGFFFFTSDESRFMESITRWDESVAGGAFSAIFGCPDQTAADFENFVVTPRVLLTNLNSSTRIPSPLTRTSTRSATLSTAKAATP